MLTLLQPLWWWGVGGGGIGVKRLWELEPDAYVGRLKKSVLILLAARSLQASGIWVMI